MSNPTNDSTSVTDIHSLYVIGRLGSRMVSQWRFLPFSMLTPADSTLVTETVPLCFAVGTRFSTISQIASHDTSYNYWHQGEHDGRRGQITMRSDLRFTACITYPIYQRKMWPWRCGARAEASFHKIQKYTRLSTTVTSSITSLTVSIAAILFTSYIIEFFQVDQQPCSNSPSPTHHHN